MSRMKRMKSADQIVEEAYTEAINSSAETIVIQAGHFPINYRKRLPKGSEAFENLIEFGHFTPLSLDLGLQVGHALKNLRDIKFLVMVDDANYDYDKFNYNNKQLKKYKRWFYERSLKENIASSTHVVGRYILDNGFSEDHFITQRHRDKDFLYVSEKLLRMQRSYSEERTECGKSYVAMYEHLLPKSSYLVSFVPSMCVSTICEEVLDKEKATVPSTHFFFKFDSSVKPDVKQLLNANDEYDPRLYQGVWCRHD